MEHYKDSNSTALAEAGINLAPGGGDDGWAKPKPVKLADGSEVQLYKDGEALGAAFEAIKNAKSRVLLEVYIFAGDETGRAFADLLIAKARQGVRVYFIYDSFGSIWTDHSIFDRMRHAGVMVAEFNPIRPWECRYSWRPVNRDHRKLLVVDDQIAGMGGLNIANEYAGPWVADIHRPADSYWRDTSVGIVGPSARPFVRSFIQSWHYIMHGGPIARAEYRYALQGQPEPKRRVAKKLTRQRLRKLQKPDRNAPPLDLPGNIGLLASVPTVSSPLRPLLNRLVQNAQNSIRLTMAYFAPDDKLVAELCRAAQRGVKVQLMLPGRTDVWPLIIAARSFYDLLLTSGVEVYERQTVILHAKTIVVDEDITIIGSANLDYRSIDFNCELSMAVRSREFGRGMCELFENDIHFAKSIDHIDWKRRPIIDRVIQWGVSRARYLL